MDDGWYRGVVRSASSRSHGPTTDKLLDDIEKGELKFNNWREVIEFVLERLEPGDRLPGNLLIVRWKEHLRD